MRKIVEVVKVEIVNSPEGKMFSVSFYDHKEPTEQVNPLAERVGKIKKELEAKGVPKDIVAMLTIFEDMPGQTLYSNYYVPSGMVQLSPKEYQELHPEPGGLLELEIGAHKE